MNNGGKSPDSGISKRVGPEEYSRAITKVSVAQICEQVGFQSFQGPVLESLSDITIRYIKELGKITGSYSNISNRTQSNVFDLLKALEDLGFNKEIDSESRNCVTGSGVIRDLIRYVGSVEEVPFAQSLPQFPVIGVRKRMVPSFSDMGESPSGNHIPIWLPAFPDPHTYVCTPVWNQRNSDPRADKIEQARQRRKAERSLLSLQQRLMSNGSVGAGPSSNIGAGPSNYFDAGPSSSAAVGPSSSAGVGPSTLILEMGDDDREKLRLNGSNPFLATPLQDGERDISPVSFPDKDWDDGDLEKTKNHVSVLEAFAPVIDAAEGGVWEVEDREQNGFQDRRPTRPTVSFKFGSRKKLLGESSGSRHWNKNMGRQGSWLSRDEERDDRKRRADLILRQSMENPQELNQL